MHLFWSQGYVATGMSQLLQATELKPGSFYNAFSSKKALFIRSLQHYNEQIVARRIKKHLGMEDPIEAIEQFFLSAFESTPRPELIGCFLTNTATELGKMDTDISAVVWAGLRQIELGFKQQIIEARQSGLLVADLDADVTALHLLSCFQGMCVIARVTRSKAKMRSVTHSALQVLRRPI